MFGVCIVLLDPNLLETNLAGIRLKLCSGICTFSQPFHQPILGHSFPVHSIMPVAMLKRWYHAFNVHGVINQFKKNAASWAYAFFNHDKRACSCSKTCGLNLCFFNSNINSLGMEATLAALQNTCRWSHATEHRHFVGILVRWDEPLACCESSAADKQVKRDVNDTVITCFVRSISRVQNSWVRFACCE